MAVFVLDRSKTPVAPCSERRARILLGRGRARVHKLRPFTIRLVDIFAEDLVVSPVTLRIDPGSKVTGLAVTRTAYAKDNNSDDGNFAAQGGVYVLNLLELEHRGDLIRDRLAARKSFRQRRRGQLRYRPSRFSNRQRPAGWLSPSLKHRIDTIMSQVKRLSKLLPIGAVVQEIAKFDTQLLDNAGISGVSYQQGTLQGYNIREYLLEKWERRCAYCDAHNVRLQIDHIVPRSRGGSNREANLTLACIRCNGRKGAQSIDAFLKHDIPRLKRLNQQVKMPLRDATAVNGTRRALTAALRTTDFHVSTSTGARTKYNRSRFNVPKTHALDAACCGEMAYLANWSCPTLKLKACGRGTYRRTRSNKFGFPVGYLTRTKSAFGFATGDLVKATVLTGKNAGIHIGRVSIRARGSFNITTKSGLIQGVWHKTCHLLQRGDGYTLYILPTTPKWKTPSSKMM